MSNILEQIVSKKKLRIKNLTATIDNDIDIKPQKTFLTKGSPQIIAEIKRGSPSLGLLKPDLDIEAVAQHYKNIGACAISVLTEEDYFFGSIEDLVRAKQASGLPILRKDFIFSEAQIVESAQIGADAILLMVSVIKEAGRLKQLLELAHKLGLSVLVETHERQEIQIALEAGAKIIGVNNRDLRTFQTDISLSLDLKALIPSHIISVSESGIKNKEHISLLSAQGYDAFLIGEAFLHDLNFLC